MEGEEGKGGNYSFQLLVGRISGTFHVAQFEEKQVDLTEVCVDLLNQETLSSMPKAHRRRRTGLEFKPQVLAQAQYI